MNPYFENTNYRAYWIGFPITFPGGIWGSGCTFRAFGGSGRYMPYRYSLEPSGHSGYHLVTITSEYAEDFVSGVVTITVGF